MKTDLILGVSLLGHDSSCTLLDGSTGQILYSLTEERFSNLKHDGGFPAACIKNIIKKIEENDFGQVKYIAINIDPEIYLKNLVNKIAGKINRGFWINFKNHFCTILKDAQILHNDYYPLNYLKCVLERELVSINDWQEISEHISWYGNNFIRYTKIKYLFKDDFPSAQIIFIDHHECHAASAYYCSGFSDSAILTIDGEGEEATSTLNIAIDNHIERITESEWPNSLGFLYMQIAWYLGFNGDDYRFPGLGEEYKVMGMAAYGNPIHMNIFNKIGSVDPNGKIQLNFSKYLELKPVEGCPGHYQPKLTNKFLLELCERRIPGSPILQIHYDIAKSMQVFLEIIGTDLAIFLKKRYPHLNNLCIAGGVGLNGLMNMEIFKKAGFSNIFIQPASGDDGTSLGAAITTYHRLFPKKIFPPLKNAFLGINYDQEITQTISKLQLNYTKPDNLHKTVASHLFSGKIIARYVGRGEFGPRALGHRSILANPTLINMKDEVNSRIKHRESFRPFAPACIEEYVKDYFDINIKTPYMLLICKALKESQNKIPAVVHEDGTARLQTVNMDENIDLFKIIDEFNKISGVPILLNTSFNVNGEAIVETPLDAIESFLLMDIDYLAIGPYLICRQDNENNFQKYNIAEHIRRRKERYYNEYFSKNMFINIWNLSLGNDIQLYKNAAEERLKLINVLDAQLKQKNN